MGLSRILKKVNKAKQAISSLKGIASKLQNINYNSAVNSDELKEQAEKATQTLDKRRKSLQKNLTAKNSGKTASKKNPVDTVIELQYPLKENLDNWMVFTTRPRIGRERPNKRKDDANRRSMLSSGQVEIALYVPDSITTDATVSYSGDEGVGSFVRGAMKEGAGFNKIDGMLAGITQTADKMLNTLTGNTKFFLQGKAANPQLEQMLEGISFRDFTFDFEFWPKSQAEADMVNTIIYWFKTAMLPDTYPPMGGGKQEVGESAAAGEAFFNFPNIFDVRYEGPVAKKLDGFMPMVCTEVSVDHNSPSKFATYHDGQPIASSMSLSMSEIKILTQESYQELSPFTDRSEGALGGEMQSADSLLDTYVQPPPKG